MGVESIISLFNTGGIALTFIGFLIWLIRYFMAELSKVRQEEKEERIKFIEAMTNHINTNTNMMGKQTQAIEHLSHRIEIACKVSHAFHNPETIQNPGEEDESPIK